jgi:YjbE family integral membrane protein
VLTALLVLASVIFLDVLLSGDNAVVIGMAANTLPSEQRNRAIVCGMVMAAIARIIFSLFAISLLHHRLISIIGGIGLLWVAFKLGKDIVAKGDDKEPGSVRQGKDFLSAIGLIAIADISMSLDNVLAVAGIARNNPVILVFGLIVSIACLGFGAKIVSGLLERWKWLNWAGVGLITAIAVELVFGVHAI